MYVCTHAKNTAYQHDFLKLNKFYMLEMWYITQLIQYFWDPHI